MSVLNSIGGGYTRLRELAEADRDGRVIITDTTDTDIAHARGINNEAQKG